MEDLGRIGLFEAKTARRVGQRDLQWFNLPQHVRIRRGAAQALAQDCWPEPEVKENVNTQEVGNLGLTPAEEAALVAFMQTLSDGFHPFP